MHRVTVCRKAAAGLLALSVAVAGCGSAQPEEAAAVAEAAPELAGPLSALAPANLERPRPDPPFNLTGNWFVDVSDNPEAWRFVPSDPKLTPAAQAHFDAGKKASAEGKVYRDDIGQCWPAGMPLIMTRFWPMAMIQLPTAIYMVSGFMNSVRIVYLDGREHTDPDIVIRTWNGESIGRWEGDTLVIHTMYFTGHHHWMDQGGVSIPASEDLEIVERVRMVEGPVAGMPQLEIEFSMTDPQNWEGTWTSTKRFNRVDDVDITEVQCLPDLNENLFSTSSDSYIR